MVVRLSECVYHTYKSPPSMLVCRGKKIPSPPPTAAAKSDGHGFVQVLG
jgi:hypothetical protein